MDKRTQIKLLGFMIILMIPALTGQQAIREFVSVLDLFIGMFLVILPQLFQWPHFYALNLLGALILWFGMTIRLKKR